MSANANIVTGGFSDPVFDSQHIFKAVMDGMARPGEVQSFDLPIQPPSPLCKAAGGILLTLSDYETPVWMNGAFSKSVVPRWLSFHTGAQMAATKAEARFAVLDAASQLSSFDLFAQGTQEYPDRSTTIIIEVQDLTGGPKLRLTGPGIRDSEIIEPTGLPDIFPRLWSENRAVFPRGVDVILTCGSHFICLPRSIRIELEA
ncbi:phosphonate C-P lyase system protein PhnH [Rhizobium sp. 22-785-1]